jgi:hypothetical protein
MPVSLWSNQGKSGEYDDKTLIETDNNMIVKYFGQRKGGRDHLVEIGSYFFLKHTKGYTFKGRVINVSALEKENSINVFELVIDKKTPIEFRIKKDAYSHFGWNTEDVMSGIIKH